jgi:hypothetical protein
MLADGTGWNAPVDEVVHMTTRFRQRLALLAAALTALGALAGAATVTAQICPSDPPVIRG